MDEMTTALVERLRQDATANPVPLVDFLLCRGFSLVLSGESDLCIRLRLALGAAKSTVVA